MLPIVTTVKWSSIFFFFSEKHWKFWPESTAPTLPRHHALHHLYSAFFSYIIHTETRI